MNNVTLDEGAYQAIICLLSQVGLVERCVNLLDEMGSVRFDQANKLPYDVRVGLSNDDEVYKYDDPTLYRRQAYKDTIRAIARSANISTRFRGLGKNNRRTKKEVSEPFGRRGKLKMSARNEMATDIKATSTHY
mgnify:CR=1 FL=1